MATKDPIAKAPAGRVRRGPLGKKNVLTVSGKEPGYVYRIVNDTGSNIQERLDQGYELVENDSVQIGDKRIGNPGATGSVAEAHVGGGMKAVVMRIREDWYNEDQADKQAYVDATEAATKEKALEGNYGKLDISRS